MTRVAGPAPCERRVATSTGLTRHSERPRDSSQRNRASCDSIDSGVLIIESECDESGGACDSRAAGARSHLRRSDL